MQNLRPGAGGIHPPWGGYPPRRRTAGHAGRHAGAQGPPTPAGGYLDSGKTGVYRDPGAGPGALAAGGGWPYGRLAGRPACVEEIKLWQGREPPAEPATAHWAQCACYGAMVCKEETRPWVGLRVVYVDRRGKERACFEEIWTAERCQALFDALAEAYLARERIRRTHVLARNGSLASLALSLCRLSGWTAGNGRYRSTRPYAGTSGCLPACPRVQANPPRRCFRR